MSQDQVFTVLSDCRAVLVIIVVLLSTVHRVHIVMFRSGDECQSTRNHQVALKMANIYCHLMRVCSLVSRPVLRTHSGHKVAQLPTPNHPTCNLLFVSKDVGVSYSCNRELRHNRSRNRCNGNPPRQTAAKLVRDLPSRLLR
jgi:hypothetical protein